MLIEDYEIDLRCPPCAPGSEAWFATVKVHADLSELMPYVNALVEKGEYVPAVPTVTWKEGSHGYFIRAGEIGVNNLHDKAHAERKVAELVKFLNETWERRDGITPDAASKRKPAVLDILKLLPRTNCGECGVPSCMAFANLLSVGQKTVDDCLPLLDGNHFEQLDSLRSLCL